jgi:hypothetical protein
MTRRNATAAKIAVASDLSFFARNGGFQLIREARNAKKNPITYKIDEI